MTKKFSGKDLVGIIKNFETSEELEMKVSADSSYVYNSDSTNLYQKLRYYVKKLDSKVKVVRDYNCIMLCR